MSEPSDRLRIKPIHNESYKHSTKWPPCQAHTNVYVYIHIQYIHIHMYMSIYMHIKHIHTYIMQTMEKLHFQQMIIHNQGAFHVSTECTLSGFNTSINTACTWRRHRTHPKQLTSINKTNRSTALQRRLYSSNVYIEDGIQWTGVVRKATHLRKHLRK